MEGGGQGSGRVGVREKEREYEYENLSNNHHGQVGQAEARILKTPLDLLHECRAPSTRVSSAAFPGTFVWS